MPDVRLKQELYDAVYRDWLARKGIGPSAWAEFIARLATALDRIMHKDHLPDLPETRQDELHGVEGCDCAAWIAANALQASGLWKRPVRTELFGTCDPGNSCFHKPGFECQYQIRAPAETVRCSCPCHDDDVGMGQKG